MIRTELKDYQKTLYIVDMVNGFVREGKLHDGRIAATIPEQIKLIERFRRENQGVAFIKENHGEGSVEFKTFPPHCIAGTSEAELVDELKPYESSSLVYPKNSTSAVFAPNILTDIESMVNLREIVAVGCCTDICVLNFLIPLINYFNQINREIKIFAVKDATQTYNIPGFHDAEYYNKIAYELMAQSGIQIVGNSEELEAKEKELGLTLKKGI